MHKQGLTAELITLSLIKRFVPAYRFIRAQPVTIEPVTIEPVTIEPVTINQHHLSQPKLQQKLDLTSIKVLNWNVAKKSQDQNWTRDFLAILNQYNPDLIVLQEARLQTEAKWAIGLTEMSWNFAPNLIDTYRNSYSGVLTAAKIKPLVSKLILSQHYEPITKTPKSSLVTEYALECENKTLLVINAHFINFVTLNKFESQLYELEETISQHPGPIIFSGDFNTWNRARESLIQAMAARLSLTQASFSDRDRKKIKRFLLSPPLDYIFYRGLSENLASASVLDHISSSDHKPMLVELSVTSSGII